MGSSAAASGSSQFIQQESLGQTRQETAPVSQVWNLGHTSWWQCKAGTLARVFSLLASVCALVATSQGRVGTAVEPFRNGLCQGVGGLLGSSAPAFPIETPLALYSWLCLRDPSLG